MFPSDEQPDDAVLAWIKTVVGPVQVISRFAHDHGYSRLWRLRTGNDHLWLKMHAYPHKWAGEVHALTQWTPALGLTPKVLAHQADPSAVLLTETSGLPAESLDLSPQAEERMWRDAGEWLARLHRLENDWLGNIQVNGLPKDRPATDAEAFVRANWEVQLVKGRESGLFDERTLDFAGGTVADGLSALSGEKARAIHRDFTPRNWMASPNGSLQSVIDFEHARWDIRAADHHRPWDHEFRRNPRLVDAFYEGYGGLTETLRAQIDTMRTILAFTTVIWATGVGDGAFAQRARDTLARMRASE